MTAPGGDESDTAPFRKYAEKGAYHWGPTVLRAPLRRGLRLAARYDLAVRFLREAGVVRGARGLDIGCGDGVLLHQLHGAGYDALGVDLEPEGLRQARRMLLDRGEAAPLFAASAYRLPLATGSMAFVTSVEVIEHLENVAGYLAEVARVLAPGGVAVFTTPQRLPGQDAATVRDPYHVHEYVAPELAAALRGVFPDVAVYGAYPAWLDQLYQGPGWPRWAARLARTVLRGAALVAGNPYVRLTRPDPDQSWRLLVARVRMSAR